MKLVIQRTNKASVTIDNTIVGQIEDGLVVLVGITENDTTEDVQAMVHKLIHLRIFEDEAGKLNKSLMDISGSILSISQFTLYADVRKGRRPSFVKAAHPDKATALYEQFNQHLSDEGVHVETGEFGAMMDVALVNQGPVTIILETKD